MSKVRDGRQRNQRDDGMRQVSNEIEVQKQDEEWREMRKLRDG